LTIDPRLAMPAGGSLVADGNTALTAFGHAALGALAMPFDVARAAHAAAVQWGLVRRSMLASRDFENALVLLERLTLGPLSRRV
jgi:hypothetical protein